MIRTIARDRGMSLVEATIILLVLMLVTGVLAPSMYDFIVDAKMVKVKEDCEAIGVSVMRLVRDVGPCLKYKAGDCGGCDDPCGDCSDCNQLPVIYSRGNPGGHNWPAQGGSMEEQLTSNMHNGHQIYPLPIWRGAYLPGPIGPDPWGTRYGVNTKFLGEKLLIDPTPRPKTDADVDVYCLSGGPNKRYETCYDGSCEGGTERKGDDFVYVISGSQYARMF